MFKNYSEKRERLYDDVMYLRFRENMGTTQISEVLGISRRTIYRWLRTFASENPKTVSKMREIRKKPVSAQPCVDSNDIQSLQAEIQRLKLKLAQESLRADAYDEMINVAEKQFNIQIRKKAGAKQ